MPPLIFRKGLDLRQEVAHELAESYHSGLVAAIKDADHRFEAGRLTLHLAREFGFCYGVDRAVDYAYQARRRFADRRVFLTGEIIHNPHVNDEIRGLGIHFLSDPEASVAALTPDDVVILPAFGVTTALLQDLMDRGCTLVDTTCGSVLNVWKNVRRYAAQGFTSIIHGKYWHEETQATASQAHAGRGHSLVVLDRAEALDACDFIRHGGDARRFLERFEHSVSPGFDPERHLGRVGCANQTTMLSSESLHIGELFREAIQDRYGVAALPERFQAFDTICSATQDRQDAIATLLDEHRLDLMIVLGGYNSSNTCNLARMAAARVPTYHIAGPDGLTSAAEIRHKPVGGPVETCSADWIGAGPVTLGLTSGASTPDNLVEATIRRLVTLTAG